MVEGPYRCTKMRYKIAGSQQRLPSTRRNHHKTPAQGSLHSVREHKPHYYSLCGTPRQHLYCSCLGAAPPTAAPKPPPGARTHRERVNVLAQDQWKEAEPWKAQHPCHLAAANPQHTPTTNSSSPHSVISTGRCRQTPTQLQTSCTHTHTHTVAGSSVALPRVPPCLLLLLWWLQHSIGVG